MQVDGFDWDAANSSKNEEKHGISHSAIEEFFQSDVWVAPDLKHSELEDRFLALGQTADGRHMIVAFTFRLNGKKRLVRPISARYMHANEVKKYAEAFSKNENRR